MSNEQAIESQCQSLPYYNMCLAIPTHLEMVVKQQAFCTQALGMFNTLLRYALDHSNHTITDLQMTDVLVATGNATEQDTHKVKESLCQ